LAAALEALGVYGRQAIALRRRRVRTSRVVLLARIRTLVLGIAVNPSMGASLLGRIVDV